jgi:hypothetical protein
LIIYAAYTGERTLEVIRETIAGICGVPGLKTTILTY